MGNSTSALPYIIENETHSSTRPGSYGWSMHNGKRKSDGLAVTVFKAEKKTLVKKSLASSMGGGNTDPTMTQILQALFHFQKIKTILHPSILRTYATLDTDFPNGDTPESSNNVSSAIANPMSIGALERFPVTGDLIIVTEQVIPLNDYLNNILQGMTMQNQNADAIAWGIYSLIQALDFLHNTAKLAHGNICLHSIFVTPAGDFKLGTFNLLTPVGEEGAQVGPTRYFKHFERDITPREYRSPERIDGRWEAITKSPVHAMDSYSLGVLIEEIYRQPGSGTQGKVPDKLIKAVQRLKISSLSARPRVAPLAQCPIFDNGLIKAHLFLDSIAAKPSEEKIVFLQALPDLLMRGVLPSNVAIHKVLPILVRIVTTIAGTEGAMTQEINRRECLAVVMPLLYIAEHYLALDHDKFTLQMKPVVEQLFRVNDRGVRGALLTKVSLFVKHFDPPTLNSSIFDPLCSGFTDSSAPLRELTLKSSLLLVPVLSPVSTEKLGRYLVRLQGDSEASIRTNTIIFIGKIAGNLSEQSRNKLLLPAFTRAMKDTFNPCRLAACKAVWTCRDYFTPKALAENVLPTLLPHLVDPVEDIRNETFRVVDGFIDLVRQESERMTQEAVVAAAANAGSVPSDSGLDKVHLAAVEQNSSKYLSGWSTWATSKIQTTTLPSNNLAVSKSDGSLNRNSLVSSVSSSQSPTNALSIVPQKKSPEAILDDNDGWSDDEDVIFKNNNHTVSGGPSLNINSSPRLSGKLSSQSNNHYEPNQNAFVDNSSNRSGWSDDEEDDVFKNNFATKPLAANIKGSFSSTTKSLIGDIPNESDFFGQMDSKPLKSSGGKLIVPVKSKSTSNAVATTTESGKEKPKMTAIKIKSSTEDAMKDGWDDF